MSSAITSKKRKRDNNGTTMSSNTKSGLKKKPTKSSGSSSSSSALSAEQFLSNGKSLHLTITDETGQIVLESQECKAKQFSTGSLGWSLNGKKFMTTFGDGEKKEVKVQVNCNLIIDGSKPTTTKSSTADSD